MKTFEEFKMALNEKDAGEEDSKTLKSLAKKNMSSKGARRFTKNFDDNTLRSMQAAIGITLAMEWKGPEGSEYSKYNKISDKDVIKSPVPALLTISFAILELFSSLTNTQDFIDVLNPISSTSLQICVLFNKEDGALKIAPDID